MASRMAARFVPRRFSSSGKVLSEEEKAAENVYIKVIYKFPGYFLLCFSFELFGCSFVVHLYKYPLGRRLSAEVHCRMMETSLFRS